jgi:hypothetical protein
MVAEMQKSERRNTFRTVIFAFVIAALSRPEAICTIKSATLSRVKP